MEAEPGDVAGKVIPQAGRRPEESPGLPMGVQGREWCSPLLRAELPGLPFRSLCTLSVGLSVGCPAGGPRGAALRAAPGAAPGAGSPGAWQSPREGLAPGGLPTPCGSRFGGKRLQVTSLGPCCGDPQVGKARAELLPPCPGAGDGMVSPGPWAAEAAASRRSPPPPIRLFRARVSRRTHCSPHRRGLDLVHGGGDGQGHPPARHHAQRGQSWDK